jgi:hypothetical protein
MRGMRRGLGLIVALGFGVLGCAEHKHIVKPPKHPDEFNLPPEVDGRFSSPPQYPKSVNKDNDPDRMAGGGGAPNVGAMNMGGMGGGGMGGGGMGGMGGPMGMGASSMMGGYGGR